MEKNTAAAESRFGPEPNCTPGKCRWLDTARRYRVDWSTFDQGAHQRSIDNRLGALPALVPGLTILVVDDDDFVLDSTRIILEDLGARVLTARDGGNALDQLAAHTPDLVLSDLVTVEMDGYQLVARVRSGRHSRRRELLIRQLSRLRAFAKKERRKARGLQQRSRFARERTSALPSVRPLAGRLR